MANEVKNESIWIRRHAQYTFERLILELPHIHTEGLCTDGFFYYIISKDADKPLSFFSDEPDTEKSEKTYDTVRQWFDDACRPITTPVRLVPERENHWTEIPSARTLAERAGLVGEPLPIDPSQKELCRRLPRDFPLVTIEGNGLPIKLIVQAHSISGEERDQLTTCFESYMGDTPYEIHFQRSLSGDVDSTPNAGLPKKIPIPNISVPSRFELPSEFPTSVKNTFEEDTAFWTDYRELILSSDEWTPKDVMPEGFRSGGACFLEPMFSGACNIRNLLLAFDQVVISLPVDSAVTPRQLLTHLNLTKPQLLKLVEKGVVRFVAPQPLNRYDPHFIAELVETNSNSVLFTYKLAATALIASRQRMPLIAPAISIEDRQSILMLLRHLENSEDSTAIRLLRESLVEGWINLEYTLNDRGAMSFITHGAGTIAHNILRHFRGIDHQLEFMTVNAPLSFSYGLDATYLPVSDTDWVIPHGKLVAGFLEGVPGENERIDSYPGLTPLKRDFFGLNDDAPIQEILEARSNHDTHRVRRLLAGKDIDQAERLAADLEEKALQFERQRNRLAQLNFLTRAFSNSIDPAMLEQSLSTPMRTLLRYIANRAQESDKFPQGIVDWLYAKGSGLDVDTVGMASFKRRLR